MDSNAIYLIKSGLVKISLLTEDGKEIILRLCSKDSIIGELTLFNDSKYYLSAKVLKPSEILVVNKDIFEGEIMKETSVLFDFMNWSYLHMANFQYKIRELLLNGKKGALYSTLIRLSNSYGIKQSNGILIDIVLTNGQLAKFCAASREMINQLLMDLRKAGIISIGKHGKILIKDVQFLKEEIGCDFPIEICHIN